MTDLCAHFSEERLACPLDIHVPDYARQILVRFAELTRAPQICIAGGFVRGLYMQQKMGLSPKMNDIDLFANIPADQIDALKPALVAEFGPPIRLHIGRFETEETPRGLIEFAIPSHLRAQCADAESIQLNFGADHPWADPAAYISHANVGMNQGAINQHGQVLASSLFLDDMTSRTMTMNPNRNWSIYDWTRTMKSLKRMQTERPEFFGWRIIFVPEPQLSMNGCFWDNPRPDLPSPPKF